MQLSPNFSLHEMLRSQTATRHSITEQFSPPPMVVDSLKNLCAKLLQPIRELYGGPLVVSSGYRCPRVNKLVGGKPNSQHLKGEAADLDFGTKEANKLLFEAIVEWKKRGFLEFDQLINEYDFAWIHVSYKLSGKNRNQILVVS
ncbi:peptidase M15 [Runella rosea]|uniref:Peptidase M15 n=1 Tax=Runella rosea TaxID=2259595 RepID=A0A344TC90_9BACT|nr:D-Ala-D-Ala carboxypeptidase family metallohydrolase [Runella rosea]AXE16261.1 peptidase M15 [Runella rosea]AXE21328.1 peptidase M15 [Runella rosea]